MLKNNKGITLSILVITIIVILILSSIAITSADSVLTHVRIQNLTTNMLLLRSKIESLNDEYEFNETSPENYVGIEVAGEENKNNLNGYGITIHPDDKWYILNRDDLKEIGLEEDMLKDVEEKEGVVKEQQPERFIVNYSSGEIIYTTGMSDENNEKVYTLSQLLGKNDQNADIPDNTVSTNTTDEDI